MVIGATSGATGTITRVVLESGDVTTPVWNAISGMEDFVDDSLGINSGTLPFTGGRAGIGMHANDVSRRAALDQITIARQL